MGFNTTVVVMNDALSDIRNDPEFGKRFHDAILKVSAGLSKSVDVVAGCHVNAATVVESHHADMVSVISVGGNCGRVMPGTGWWTDTEYELLKKLADAQGFTLMKKRKPKKG